MKERDNHDHYIDKKSGGKKSTTEMTMTMTMVTVTMVMIRGGRVDGVAAAWALGRASCVALAQLYQRLVWCNQKPAFVPSQLLPY
jgi:hypothetical protein